MSPSTFIAFVVAMSSAVVVNGAAVRRDGTFTYTTPQPTSPLQASGTTITASSTPTTYPTTTSTPSVTYPTTTSTPSMTYPSTTSTFPSTYPTTPSTATYPTTTSTPTSTYPITTPAPSTTHPTTSTPTTTATPTTTYPTTASTLTTQSIPTKTSIPVTSPVHSSVYGVPPPTETSTPSSTPNITYPTTAVSTVQSSGQPSVTPMYPTKIPKSVPPVSSPSVPVSNITATPTPTLCTGTANCDGVQQWQASFAYDAGDRVIFDNQLWTATQWTYDNAPHIHPDQWTCAGFCTQPIKNKANCTGVAAWQSTVAYAAGNTVIFDGSLWSAVQWTQSNSPRDTSGVWQDLGACA